MADWRPSNPSNNVDTCLWCGNKLHRQKHLVYAPEDKFKTRPTGTKPAEKTGDYEDGFFCGLRCAYQFAVKFAEWGSRLQPRGKGKQDA